jgi:hypothetical protein
MSLVRQAVTNLADGLLHIPKPALAVLNTYVKAGRNDVAEIRAFQQLVYESCTAWSQHICCASNIARPRHDPSTAQFDRHHRVNEAIFSRGLRVQFPDGSVKEMNR